MFRALGVNDGNMEEGSLRCDANVSVRPPGAARLGVKVEVKNINSFRFLQHALDYEFERQSGVLRAGGAITQETRLWDAAGGRTLPMRSKEEAHDYRYFPEPDLPPLEISAAWVAAVAEALPELPEERRLRLVAAYGIAERDAAWLAQSAERTSYFEATVRASGSASAACNWILGAVGRYLNEHDVEIGSLRAGPERLAELIAMVASGAISASAGKTVFERMAASGEAPQAIVEAEGLAQIDDSGVLGAAVREALEGNPDAVASYRAGKTGVLGFLVGQVMRRTRGKANPRAARALLVDALDGGGVSRAREPHGARVDTAGGRPLDYFLFDAALEPRRLRQARLQAHGRFPRARHAHRLLPRGARQAPPVSGAAPRVLFGQGHRRRRSGSDAPHVRG